MEEECMKMYRLIIDENNQIKLPDELLRGIQACKGTELTGRLDGGMLILEKAKAGPKPVRTEVEIIQTDVFWLPAEIAYFPKAVRICCKDPFIEVWGEDRATSLVKFIEEANKLYR
jgi:hypothetical protein